MLQDSVEVDQTNGTEARELFVTDLQDALQWHHARVVKVKKTMVLALSGDDMNQLEGVQDKQQSAEVVSRTFEHQIRPAKDLCKGLNHTRPTPHTQQINQINQLAQTPE
jgi:hypothetical protein